MGKKTKLIPYRIYPKIWTSLCIILKSFYLWEEEQMKEVLTLAGGKGEELEEKSVNNQKELGFKHSFINPCQAFTKMVNY